MPLKSLYNVATARYVLTDICGSPLCQLLADIRQGCITQSDYVHWKYTLNIRIGLTTFSMLWTKHKLTRL